MPARPPNLEAAKMVRLPLVEELLSIIMGLGTREAKTVMKSPLARTPRGKKSIAAARRARELLETGRRHAYMAEAAKAGRLSPEATRQMHFSPAIAELAQDMDAAQRAVKVDNPLVKYLLDILLTNAVRTPKDIRQRLYKEQ